MTKPNSATSALNPSGDERSLEQLFGLHDSALQSGALLEEGLRRLEEEYRGQPEVLYGILWNLSQGFELLLKLTLPLAGEKAGPSHDIPKLLDQLLRAVPAEAMLRGRHEFLSRNKLFRELMELLGKFGGPGKYSSLDAAVGRSASGESDQSVTQMWDAMMLDLLDDDWLELAHLGPARFADRYHPHLYIVVATSLARGLVSLWRLWVHGPTAERGRTWHGTLTGEPWCRVSDLVMQSGS